MSHSTVETPAAQPQLFVFKQIFTDATQQSADAFLTARGEHYNDEQQQHWTKFWESHGKVVLLQQWALNYKDYLAPECEDESASVTAADNANKTEQILPNCALPAINDSNELNADEQGWLSLWEQHCQAIYLELYTLHSNVYCDYYLNLTRSLQVETTTETAIEESIGPVDELADDLEQLALLGLPTAFGGRPQGNNKRRCQPKSRFVPIYSVCFSDEDSEDSNMDLNDVTEENSTIITTDDALHKLQHKVIKKKKKKKNRKQRNVPAFLLQEKGMLKYWHKRFSLFSRYDEGIRLDRESWFSVTPEQVADHLAVRLACDVLIDGFCGCGGNAIQFAKRCGRVIAIDIDASKVEMAKHNAAIYGVAHKIDFIVGDFLQLCDGGQFRGDVVFLSPPWGGPAYKRKQNYDIERCLLPCGATELMSKAQKIGENVALFLPRNSDLKQIIKLAGVGNRCEVEHNYLDSRLVAITALYGEQILSNKSKKENVVK